MFTAGLAAWTCSEIATACVCASSSAAPEQAAAAWRCEVFPANCCSRLCLQEAVLHFAIEDFLFWNFQTAKPGTLEAKSWMKAGQAEMIVCKPSARLSAKGSMRKLDSVRLSEKAEVRSRGTLTALIEGLSICTNSFLIALADPAALFIFA